MASLYRVLAYLDAANDGEPGHPLYVPSSTGASRIDNPDAYDTLYLGDGPACAVAEAFGWAPRWNAGLLRGTPSLPGSVRALVSYELADDVPVCDLDDADRLADLSLRPSRVVTRNRTVTQSWARKLFDAGEFAGVRWWSYYNPDWGSVGLWDTAAMTVTDVVVLPSGRLTMAAPGHHFAAEPGNGRAARLGRAVRRPFLSTRRAGWPSFEGHWARMPGCCVLATVERRPYPPRRRAVAGWAAVPPSGKGGHGRAW